ncbi:MAG: hypothetical protein M0017_04250 [Desulfobacteraceae bacterium]|nr:hypothetical protein [Desulfobacteraceae bacterium]
MKHAKTGGEHAGRRQCPWVKAPFEECFCRRMNSLSTEAIIYYCGGNFSECEIYRRHPAPPPGRE